jgi:hypothetical protein
MRSATGELSLVLSLEQLVVLGGVLGEPVPAYVTDTLEELTRARREAALEEARQSLVRRRIVIPGEPFMVPIAASRLVEVMCRPELSIVVHQGEGPHWSAAVTRIAAVPEASVEVRAEDNGELRLTPLYSTQLLERLSFLCQLAPRPAPAAPAATVPLGLLRAAAAAGQTEVAAQILQDGGVPEMTADSAGAALVAGRRYAVSAVLRAGAGQRTGGELAWAAGADGYWVLPPALSPIGGDPADGVSNDNDFNGDSDGITVRLLPASGDDLLTALATTLPIEQ